MFDRRESEAKSKFVCSLKLFHCVRSFAFLLALGFNFGEIGYFVTFCNCLIFFSLGKMSSRASRTLYVGNLPGDIREREVEDLFYKVISLFVFVIIRIFLLKSLCEHEDLLFSHI